MGQPNHLHTSLAERLGVYTSRGAQGKPKPYGLQMLEDKYVITSTEERLRERLPTLPSWSLGIRLQALALAPWTALAVQLT